MVKAQASAHSTSCVCVRTPQDMYLIKGAFVRDHDHDQIDLVPSTIGDRLKPPKYRIGDNFGKQETSRLLYTSWWLLLQSQCVYDMIWRQVSCVICVPNDECVVACVSSYATSMNFQFLVCASRRLIYFIRRREDTLNSHRAICLWSSSKSSTSSSHSCEGLVFRSWYVCFWCVRVHVISKFVPLCQIYIPVNNYGTITNRIRKSIQNEAWAASSSSKSSFLVYTFVIFANPRKTLYYWIVFLLVTNVCLSFLVYHQRITRKSVICELVLGKFII